MEKSNFKADNEYDWVILDREKEADEKNKKGNERNEKKWYL